MRMHLFLSATAAAAALAGSAMAAPAAGDWTGWYVGIHGGGAFGTSDWTDLIVPEDSGQDIPGRLVKTSPSGGFGGVHGGYNQQFGQYVLGLEGDLSGAGISDRKFCIGNYVDYAAKCRSEIDFMGDVTARAGMVFNQALLYAKGGIAFADSSFVPSEEVTVVGFTRIPPGYKTTHDFRWGPTVGVGAEYALDPHWTVGVEYDFQDFGQKRVTFNPRTGIAGAEADLSPVFTISTTQEVNLIEAKVNYRF